MIKKNIIYSIIILFFNCNPNTGENTNIDKDLSLIIDNYIKENPINTFREKGKTIYESGYSYPSYHIYFEKIDNDTLFKVFYFPFLNTFNPNIDYSNSDVYIKSEIPKGVFYYKKKYPLIIFDNKNIYVNFFNKDSVIIEIPDSLKAGREIQDYKLNRWMFKIEDKKFINVSNN